MSSPPVWGRLPDVSGATEDDERRRVESRGKIFQRFRWNELPWNQFRWSAVASRCVAHRSTLASVAVLSVMLIGGAILMRIVLHGGGTSDEQHLDGGSVVADSGSSHSDVRPANPLHPATAQVQWRGDGPHDAVGAATNSPARSDHVADARYSSGWPKASSTPPWAQSGPPATTATAIQETTVTNRQTVDMRRPGEAPAAEPGAAANRPARVEYQPGTSYQPGIRHDSDSVLPGDHPHRLPHVNQQGSTGTSPPRAGRYGPTGSTWMAEDASQPPRGEPTRVAELTGTIETAIEGTHRR